MAVEVLVELVEVEETSGSEEFASFRVRACVTGSPNLTANYYLLFESLHQTFYNAASIIHAGILRAIRSGRRQIFISKIIGGIPEPIQADSNAGISCVSPMSPVVLVRTDMF